MRSKPLDAHIINPTEIRDISGEILDAEHRLKILPASYYEGTTALERGLVGLKYALYALHTQECVSWLRERIAGRMAIEIGAGNGVLARALQIPATDNRMQEWPSYKALYEAIKQPPIVYGKNVEKLDAIEAARRYRPAVIVAAWVTHRYDPADHARGGNEQGVDEVELLGHCEEYLFVGNRQIHERKPIWPPDELIEPPWLYSRALNGSPNFLGVWKGRKSASKERR